MDISPFLAIAGPVVTAIAVYLRDQAAQKAADKAAEAVGTEAGKALASSGPNVLTTIRGWFTAKNDVKAQQALAHVEQDPTDDDYQQKLIKETARLASTDAAFAQELKILAQQVTVAQPGSTVQTYHTQDSVVGVQGQNSGTVSQHIGEMPHRHDRDTTGN